jgi:ATP-dependent Lon protease
LAAHRAGIKTLIMPHGNSKDISDIPQRVRAELQIIPVKSMDEVLQIALCS